MLSFWGELTSPLYQVAIGRREVLNIFGNDYNTEDGTGEPRNGGPEGNWGQLLSLPPKPGLCHRSPGLYPCCRSGKGTHSSLEETEGAVWLPGRMKGSGDEGVIESWANVVQRVVSPSPIPFSSLGQIYNLGTGTGYSVLQMVQAMEKASGKKVSCQSRPPAPLSVVS